MEAQAETEALTVEIDGIGLLSFFGSAPRAPFAASPLNWLVGVGKAAADRETAYAAPASGTLIGHLKATGMIAFMVQTRSAVVLSVSRDSGHRFSKPSCEEITLLEGLGVAGDAHLGVTVQHRSRVVADPTQPNLRQVHLIHSELFAEVAASGFTLRPGDMGENVTTAGIDLLALPRGAQLLIGHDALIEVTGLRNPCAQINAFKPGLLKTMVGHDDKGRLIRKAGIMGIVLQSGVIRPGDKITVALPQEPHHALGRV